MFKIGDKVRINWTTYDYTASNSNDRIKKWDDACNGIHTITNYNNIDSSDKYNYELDKTFCFSLEELLPEKELVTMKIKYKNWKGETRNREVFPINIWYGHTDYHKENQWLLKAHDIEDENIIKNFAMADIIEIYK